MRGSGVGVSFEYVKMSRENTQDFASKKTFDIIKMCEEKAQRNKAPTHRKRKRKKTNKEKKKERKSLSL